MLASTSPSSGRDNALARTWLLLLALSIASVVIMKSAESGIGDSAALVLILAFIKVGLIGRHFMELYAAPTGLQIAFGVWVVGTCTLLVILTRT